MDRPIDADDIGDILMTPQQRLGRHERASTTTANTTEGISINTETRSGVAPDVLQHFKDLARAAPIALLVAAIVGATVFGLSRLEDKKFEVTTTAQIDAQVPVQPGDAYLYQNSAPYLALTTSAEVRDAVARSMGSGWTAERVAADVSVTESKSPLLIDVTASGSSPEEAIKLSLMTIEALDNASREQREAELARASAGQTARIREFERQRDRLPAGDSRRVILQQRIDAAQEHVDRILAGGVNGLSALAVPNTKDARQTSPMSPMVAAFAALVTFIVVAELLVLFRGRLGPRIGASAARRIARRSGVRFDDAPAQTVVPTTRAYLSRAVGDGRQVLIVYTQRAQDTAHRLADSDRVAMTALTAHWPEDLAPGMDTVVLLAESGEPVRTEIRDAASTINELGLTGHLTLLPTQPKETTTSGKYTPAASASSPSSPTSDDDRTEAHT